MKDLYFRGINIAVAIAFLISYVYCIANYGFLFGVGLGWLPSIIVGVVAGLLWPLIAGVLLVIVIIATR